MVNIENNLVWLDLEMTGLDPERDRIIEIALVVTNSDLEIIAEGPDLAIHQADDVLNDMDEWNTEHHSRSGLIDRVRDSNIHESDAQSTVLKFLEHYVLPQKSPICGNSIHQDRRFLQRYMPELEKYFHYRNLDVSTIKILAQMWVPEILTGMTKTSQHRALKDVYDSINELKYYREHFFKSSKK